MKKLKLQILSLILIFTIVFVPNATMAKSFYTLDYPENTSEIDYNLYSIIKDDMDIQPQALNPVLVFIAGAIAGGIIYDGVKWVVVSVYNEGLRSTLNTVVRNVNRYTPQDVPGRTGEIVEVTATSTGQIQYFYDSNGCVLSPSGMVWNCPYKL